MELTTFTTAQIYSIFAALSCAAFSGILFYCLGLRTGNAAGYELGRATAKDYWSKIIGHVRADLGEARDLLDARTREMAALRQSIEQETVDRAEVERDLLNRLAAATPLAAGDHATLLNAAGKLQLAASTFAGIGAHDHAHTCSNLKSQVLEMAARAAQANTKPHPDSELIEWLNDHAVHYIPDMSLVQIEMPTTPLATSWPPHIREMLRTEIQRHVEHEEARLARIASEQSESVVIEGVSLSVDGGKPIGTGRLEIRMATPQAKQEDAA